MAVTDIQATVLRITGVTPTANSVEDAQRFVVSSVPKDLLMFAQKASSPSTDGSAISFSVNDSITDVQRNGYGCTEIPMSDASWVLDSSSLRFATAKRPVFYHKQGAVHFAPVTDGSNAGYVFYVDFSLIDDSCDLRNAVIFHAASQEFTKIATDKTVDYINQVVPEAPTLQDNSISFSTDVPTFTPPVMSAPDFGDTDNLISTEEDSEMLSARVQEIQTKVGEYSARMAEAQAVFNKENAEYQAQLQISIQNAQLSSQDDGQKLQDYSSKVQTYSSEVNEQIQKIGTAVQNMSYYSNESKKYYEWARMEVQQYVQNNSKMIQAGIAMQSASQQQQGRR